MRNVPSSPQIMAFNDVLYRAYGNDLSGPAFSNRLQARWEELAEGERPGAAERAFEVAAASLNSALLERAIEWAGVEASRERLSDLELLMEIRDNVFADGDVAPIFIQALQRAANLYGYAFEQDSMEAALRPMTRVKEGDIPFERGLKDAKTSLLLAKQFVSEGVFTDTSVGTKFIQRLPKVNTITLDNRPQMAEALALVKSHLRFDKGRCRQILEEIGTETALADSVKGLLEESGYREYVANGLSRDGLHSFAAAMTFNPLEVLRFINGLSGAAFDRACTDDLLELVLQDDWISAEKNFDRLGDKALVAEFQAFVQRLLDNPIYRKRLKDHVKCPESIHGPWLLLRRYARPYFTAPLPSASSMSNTGIDSLTKLFLADAGTRYFADLDGEVMAIIRDRLRALAAAKCFGLEKSGRLPAGWPSTDTDCVADRERLLDLFALQIKVEVGILETLTATGDLSEKDMEHLPVYLTHGHVAETLANYASFSLVAARVPADVHNLVCRSTPVRLAGAIRVGLVDGSEISSVPEGAQTRLLAAELDI